MNTDFYIKNTKSKFISIKGEDKADFLQGLITNDIFKCRSDNPIYSCLLTPQGKFLADFFIVKLTDSYLIEIHEKYFSQFLSRLEIYKLRSDVNFTYNTNIESIILFSKKDYSNLDPIILFEDPRNKNIGKKVYINSKNIINLKNLSEKTFDLYKEILMKNLVPFTPDDLIENKSLLLENNFQNIQAIDWEKGCFVGQEITARMKYRALLKKQIYALELVSGKIKKGDDIIIDKISIGKVISTVNKYALCMLKIDLVKEKNEKKESIDINSSINLKFL